ncbi:endonuclease/exonuclease/phosphatase family protein [Amnibacterium sp. CER49]|uniref:endonuclease/exonuclease/phosphatase family protein n=1 Tax=Amnibacterium sp. CER49 TaxID=3039161 RepID=UPI002446FF6C|nr:endonuclease/exonuclease/phosphatase family protein [Amnibacterium sp. CER49]MDH2442874.1 endonuclease/exonuclease/phosphatase family protein [Amnibacterium sp. CER49]
MAARRIRVRAAAGVAALVTAGCIGGLLAAPATAATAPDPRVRTVAGNGTVSLAWDAVPGATGYAVRWNGTTRAVSERRITISGLPNGTTLTATVAARGLAGSSTTVRATPTAGYPDAITGVTASAGTGNTLVVHATGGGTATRIGVMAGGDASTNTFHFRTSWYPATQRTFVVTVPAAVRAELGRGTGNGIFVRVVQSNGLDPSAVMHRTSSPAEAYRVSVPTARALAGAATPVPAGVSPVTVAAWNVNSLNATIGASASNQWPARASRVARTVLAAHPDLLLTAELTTQGLDPSCHNVPSQNRWCLTQHTDLAHRLAAGGGYADVFPQGDQAVQDFERAHPSAGHLTFGTQILYDPARLTLGAHGTISPRFTLHVAGWPSTLTDRWLSWAAFTVRSSGRRFVAVAVHLPSGHTTQLATLRDTEARALDTYIDGVAGHLPVVLGGDLNADALFDPTPGQRALVQRGWFDAAATTVRYGTYFHTYNGCNGTDGADYGYPLTVHRWDHPARRIDYILLKRSPYSFRYANVLHLAAGSSTRVDRAYEGSDHLMQVATVGIGAPS